MIVRTFLEIDYPAAVRAARPPRLDGIEVARVEPPDGALSRWFYVEVGTPHRWIDNLGRSAAEWQAWAEQVETWVATVAGQHAGYYELRAQDGIVEVAYFGLLARFQGVGLGGFLLTHAGSSSPRASGFTPTRRTGPRRCPTTWRAGCARSTRRGWTGEGGAVRPRLQ